MIEVPPEDSDAYPYLAIDELELSIARAGDEGALALARGPLAAPPVLDSVPYGEALVVHLSGRSQGVEVAYGRSCAVDVSEGSSLTPHLYLSRAVRWGFGPQLDSPRGQGVLGIAVKGTALFVGGGGVDNLQAARFNPSNAIMRDLEAQLQPRVGGTFSKLGDGGIRIGGVDAEGAPTTIVEHILPSELTAGNQVVAQEGPALRGHASLTLVDGTVLVTGGEDLSAAPVLASTAWIFSLGGEQLEPGRQITSGLATPRTQHSMTRMGNEAGADVLIIGGLDDDDAAIAQAELYRPLRSAFEIVDSALLVTPRYGHQSIRLPGGFVLIIGGLSPDPLGGAARPVREMELYDPVQGVFTEAGVLPSAAGVTKMSIVELPDGRYLLTGGLDLDGTVVSTALIARFDPIDGVVDLSLSDPLDTARSGHSSVVLCDGTVLAAGGTAAPGLSTERYSPPSDGRR